jgi:hypothetical protein
MPLRSLHFLLLNLLALQCSLQAGACLPIQALLHGMASDKHTHRDSFNDPMTKPLLATKKDNYVPGVSKDVPLRQASMGVWDVTVSQLTPVVSPSQQQQQRQWQRQQPPVLRLAPPAPWVGSPSPRTAPALPTARAPHLPGRIHERGSQRVCLFQPRCMS